MSQLPLCPSSQAGGSQTKKDHLSALPSELLHSIISTDILGTKDLKNLRLAGNARLNELTKVELFRTITLRPITRSLSNFERISKNSAGECVRILRICPYVVQRWEWDPAEMRYRHINFSLCHVSTHDGQIAKGSKHKLAGIEYLKNALQKMPNIRKIAIIRDDVAPIENLWRVRFQCTTGSRELVYGVISSLPPAIRLTEIEIQGVPFVTHLGPDRMFIERGSIDIACPRHASTHDNCLVNARITDDPSRLLDAFSATLPYVETLRVGYATPGRVNAQTWHFAWYFMDRPLNALRELHLEGRFPNRKLAQFLVMGCPNLKVLHMHNVILQHCRFRAFWRAFAKAERELEDFTYSTDSPHFYPCDTLAWYRVSTRPDGQKLDSEINLRMGRVLRYKICGRTTNELGETDEFTSMLWMWNSIEWNDIFGQMKHPDREHA